MTPRYPSPTIAARLSANPAAARAIGLGALAVLLATYAA